jgi:hypothetical protein
MAINLMPLSITHGTCRAAGILTSLDGGGLRSNTHDLLAFIDVVAVVAERLCEQMALTEIGLALVIAGSDQQTRRFPLTGTIGRIGHYQTTNPYRGNGSAVGVRISPPHEHLGDL